MPNVAMVSINATHSLLAVAYRDGSLSCFAFDSATLALKSDAVWRVPAAQESAKLDSVSVLQWSPCHHEEVLCIGTYEGGLSLYHVNGTCLLRSRRSVTDNTISSTPGFLGSYTVKGCLHACWSPRGTRIVLVEPSSQQVASYALGQVITSPFQCSSREDFGHVAVLYDHQLQLCRGTAREGGKLEMVTPTTYLSTSCSSLRFGAISPSGQYVVCSGTIGCTVLDRRTHRWCSSDASEVFSCVAHPTWLMEEVMALPIYTHTTLQCEIVLLRPASPSPRQHISRLPMDAKPMLLGSSPGNHPREAFFSVVNVDQRLRMYRVTMDQRRAHCVVVPLQSVTLLGNLRNPLSAIPLGRCREQERPWMLLHSSVDHGLKLASWGPPKEEIPDRPPGDPEATVIPLVPFGHDGTPMVLQVWQDHLHPTKDLCFIVHEHAGLYFYHVIPTKEGGTSPDATFMIERTMIAATEGDMTALGIEAANGCVMIAEMRSDAPAQRRSRSSSPMHLRSVLYAHAILTSVVQQNIAGDSPNAHSVRRASLVTQWSCDPGLCFWLEQLRQRGTFVQTVDLCLHTILNDWPSSGQHSGQRLHALQWMLSMLRNYPEFHEVVVGCLRKIETKKSVMLLDLLGSPMNVYQECIAHYQFREAAHLVRLIMMGNLRWTMIEGSEDPQGPVASLQQASDCVVDLFGRSLSHGDYDGANNLLRFLALLHHEMELPGGTSAYGTQPPLIVRLLPQWLRGPSTSRPTLADHPSLRVDLPTVSPTTRNHSAFESIQGPQPTLVNESASAVVEGSPTCEMLRLFELHPELPRSLVAEGLRLLVNGLLGELDDFLRTFSCSPAHFVNVHLSDFDSKMQVDLEESSATFNTFLSGLHNQLGIPLPHHTIGARGVKQLQGYQVALDEGDATGEVMSDWTQAQCILYSNANVLQLTEKWRVMLAGHPLHELALDLLLMRKSNVMNAIHRLDDGGTTEGCDASLMRVIISGLSSVPGLHAYHKLLTTSYQQVDAARDAQR